MLKGDATDGDDDIVRRVSPAGVEAAVVGQVRALLHQLEVVVGTWLAARAGAPDLTEAEMRKALHRLNPLWDKLFPAEQARIVRLLVERVKVGPSGADIRLRAAGLTGLKKTEQPVQFELTEQPRGSLLAWLGVRGGALDGYVFPSRARTGKHLSTRQYARLVGKWVEAAGLGRSAYGTHSLRRTKVALIYKRTGNLRAVQILLGHTKLESTVRYLGVEAEDALTLSEATEI